MEATAAAIGFSVLALAHSILGERELLRPLFARSWEIGLPRRGVERVLRFAWHLTSVAWLGLAALALGLSAWGVLAAVALVSGLVVFFSLRGHLAWPIFLATALAAGLAGGLVGTRVLVGTSVVAAVGLGAVALLHAAWAAGRLSWMLAWVVPASASGAPLFRPPWWASLAVAVALAGAAGAIVLAVVGVAVPGRTAALVGITAVFVLRAVGDGRRVGFGKREHGSAFARLDDAVYTPLAVLFAFGGAAALLL
jgi:cytochrome c oxidase subunit IV